ASAQVKSAILLAGLHASSKTVIREKEKSRDHTERMLRYFGAGISVKGHVITLTPGRELKAAPVLVPADISSAAYFLAAAAMIEDSEVVVRDVGVNPTRTGLIEVMKRMGANVKLTNRCVKNGEPVADIRAKTSGLKGVVIGGAVIPKLIDEIPVIAVMAAFACGRTVIKDAAELKVKETDRIKTVTENLRKSGVMAVEKPDGMIIYGRGPKKFGKAVIDSHGDHRIAMAFTVAAMASDAGMKIKDVDCVNTSFPKFFGIVSGLGRRLK
ncbi:MAG TPA: 3-phosphoshikimate 1-carboxyvinyltransferase, partial [Candidatus Goldiibacteriota bacterium]|nr:3-phosphoshikimate 1-carboxyvinyltransferase [Candidatus Goldiibacteriota bacterium]